MDSKKKIEELLAKYWECETSLEEEKALREFFQGGQIPESLKETSALFQYFREQQKKALNDVTFEGQVMNHIKPVKSKGVSRMLYNSMRIAAGLLVLMTAIWFVRTEIRKTIPQEVIDTYDDPQLAFEETKKALLIISRSFGRAEEQAKKINVFNEAQEQIQGEVISDQEKEKL